MNTKYVYQSAQMGEFRPAVLFAAGPASYSQTTSDVVYNPGANEYINFASECASKSGLYTVQFVPTAAGVGSAYIRAGAPSPSQSGWKAQWCFSGKGGNVGVGKLVIATAGSGQTNGVTSLTANSTTGMVTAAVAQITIAGGLVTAAVITNPGVYAVGASTPTFTVAQSGTPGTLTATLAQVGQEVPTGTVLSAEAVQFQALVSQL